LWVIYKLVVEVDEYIATKEKKEELEREEKRKRIEAERKEKEKKQIEIDNYIKQVKQRYPKAYEYLKKSRNGGFTYSDEYMYDKMSFVDFSLIESDIRTRKLRNELEKNLELHRKREAFEEITNIVSKWEKISSCPNYSLYYYYPKNDTKLLIDVKDIQIRRDIWEFKDGSYYIFSSSVSSILKHFFGEHLKYVTFVCVPPSKSVNYTLRYKKFSSSLCKELGMEDGCPHINVISDRGASHLGYSGDSNNYILEQNFFDNKNVIIFDDIITTGKSISLMRDKLRDNGARVLCSITLGRTVHQLMGKHPYDLLFHR
jgi:hypothetical protein